MNSPPMTADPSTSDLAARLRNLTACEAGCESRCRECPDDVVREAATEIDRLRAALKDVAAVERQIRLMAYTSAGDPKLMDDMKMYAIWSGTLQKALADAL